MPCSYLISFSDSSRLLTAIEKKIRDRSAVLCGLRRLAWGKPQSFRDDHTLRQETKVCFGPLPPIPASLTLVSVLARDRVESAYLTYECVRVWVVSKDTGVWTMDSEYVLGSARCYTSETYK